jgi:hypothetical protein
MSVRAGLRVLLHRTNPPGGDPRSQEAEGLPPGMAGGMKGRGYTSQAMSALKGLQSRPLESLLDERRNRSGKGCPPLLIPTKGGIAALGTPSPRARRHRPVERAICPFEPDQGRAARWNPASHGGRNPTAPRAVPPLIKIPAQKRADPWNPATRATACGARVCRP